MMAALKVYKTKEKKMMMKGLLIKSKREKEKKKLD